ncbi:hypothetical protein BGW38_001240 [Lunasporangiospora selenospora]|uniref:Dioxygenase n=1 Tax=Lunasporangiospora selenospora TaxID=979761 RepID=A0A9P6FUH4_9FUNG|nr:hypothetical protein BGW38_001240 [Lunasporangiospora selenospora]
MAEHNSAKGPLPRKESKPLSAIAPDIKVRTKDRTSAHPHPYLHGNFYPVFEETVSDEGIECEITGVIPESLRGCQYVRTGPNSLNVASDDAPHHFFDGEGMLHGVYFEPGQDAKKPIRARYMNRWVRSEIFKKANGNGRAVIPLGLIMGGTGASFFWVLFQLIWYQLKGMYYRVKDVGNGNTALAFFGSRLLALQEAGRPVETAVPSLNTTGSYYFEEGNEESVKKSSSERQAIDPKTGEMIFFVYNMAYPFAKYSVVSASGKRVVWEQPIPGFERAAMMHDFATTPTHSIIMNLPYTIDAAKHRKEGKPVIAFDYESPSRFGILPRYFDASKDEVIWFDTRTCHIFHTANAWDEKDADGNVVAICMTACRSERFVAEVNLWQPKGADHYGGGKTVEEFQTNYKLPGSGDYSSQDPDAPYLTLFRFDLKTRQTQLTTLSTTKMEFPMVNYDQFMQPNLRYVFGATVADSEPGVGLKFDGVLKTDVTAVLSRQKTLLASGQASNTGGEGRWEIGREELLRLEAEEKTTQVYKFGPYRFGSEAMFVPNTSNADADEDDGHLLVYVYDERQLENGVAVSKKQVTELWIFDAKKVGPGHDPICKVKVPRRIPYGFHGLLVTRKQIQENKDMLESRV